MTIIEKVLLKKNISFKPIWFMRQAGRHLPEFRKIRNKNRDFVKLCFNSNLSSKISLQPIIRYNLDAAIIFSDILLIPFALGQKLKFTKKSGPILSEFNTNKFKKNDRKKFIKKLSPVYKCIKITRKKLKKDKTLISFVGAPWTLLVYMMNLKNSFNKINNKKFNSLRKNFKPLVNNLIKYICLHIDQQMKSGCNVVQVFDSWAGLLPNGYLKSLCYEPNAKIVKFCKSKKYPVICFPKGIKNNYASFAKFVKPNALNLDRNIKPSWAKRNLKSVVLQGGMDPQILLKSDKIILKTAKKYLDAFKNVPYIFNLGHGINPRTKPKKILKLINFVRRKNVKR